MTSKFDSIKSKVVQATISIAVPHSSLNHTTILSLFKTDYYFYLFLYIFRYFVFLVCLFVCFFTFSANRNQTESQAFLRVHLVPQLIDFFSGTKQCRTSYMRASTT